MYPLHRSQFISCFHPLSGYLVPSFIDQRLTSLYLFPSAFTVTAATTVPASSTSSNCSHQRWVRSWYYWYAADSVGCWCVPTRRMCKFHETYPQKTSTKRRCYTRVWMIPLMRRWVSLNRTHLVLLVCMWFPWSPHPTHRSCWTHVLWEFGGSRKRSNRRRRIQLNWANRTWRNRSPLAPSRDLVSTTSSDRASPSQKS